MIKTITIEINGTSVEIPIEEARRLSEELKNFFTPTVTVYPITVTPSVPWPTWPSVPWTTYTDLPCWRGIEVTC